MEFNGKEIDEVLAGMGIDPEPERRQNDRRRKDKIRVVISVDEFGIVKQVFTTSKKVVVGILQDGEGRDIEAHVVTHAVLRKLKE